MSLLFVIAAMQAAPPPVDPILIPPQEESGVETESAATAPAQRLLSCVRLAGTDSDAAIAEGARWALTDGGIEAKLCLGIGYENGNDWESAERAFMRAHDLAATADDSRRTGILANAGRMALRKGDPETARDRFGLVLADSDLADEGRGNILLERAQAHVALDDGEAAQTDLIAAQALLPNDGAVWLLSATLARRQGNLDAAGDFIDRALELDQADPAILLEAGNIAIRLNAPDIAEQAWGRAAAADPGSVAGQAAARNLERLAALLADEPGVPVALPEDTLAAEENPEEPPVEPQP